MLIDSRDLAQGRLLHYDVCIVGAGAAGITLARALKSERTSICLLESGGFDIENDTQILYRGAATGPGLNPRTYLMASRLRFFGGTTNHWNGRCRPLDEMDFAKRPWIPHSGWPIERSDLASFYEQAAEVVQVEPFDRSWGEVVDGLESFMPRGGVLVGKCFRRSPPTRFGTIYRDELVQAQPIDVLLHANVLQIDLDEAGVAVSRVRVGTLTGKRFAVTARLFVLAAGAIENARLLLISDSVHKTGLGNQSDCVGRFFMEHPQLQAGHVFLTDPRAARDLLTLRDSKGVVSLSEETQRTHELLNVSMEIGPTSRLEESDTDSMALDVGEALEQIDRLSRSEVPEDPLDSDYLRCYVRSEAAPNTESRVTLDRETDALGVRRSRLVWKSSKLEGRSIARALEITARDLGKRHVGRLMIRVAEDAVDATLDQPAWRGVHVASHHMGTTRMSAAPAEGVVDGQCQVHGVSNLFIAGSSVFPTVGFANPTFTIVALALRLAQHLATRLSQI